MSSLPRTPAEPPLYNPLYWRRVRHIAQVVHSDGCTGVPDLRVEACWEHDLHYYFGRTLKREIISRAWADARFRRVIQSRSRLGRWSPMAWWRWAGVRLGGKAAWDRYREHEASA